MGVPLVRGLVNSADFVLKKVVPYLSLIEDNNIGFALPNLSVNNVSCFQILPSFFLFLCWGYQLMVLARLLHSGAHSKLTVDDMAVVAHS
jgi:hypothetical protein